MSRSLRPRRHGPPADHSYSACIPGVPVYDLQITPIVTGLTIPSLDAGGGEDRHDAASDDDTEDDEDEGDHDGRGGLFLGQMEADYAVPAGVVKKVVKPKPSEHIKKKRRRRKAYYDFGLNLPRKKKKPAAVGAAASSSKPHTVTLNTQHGDQNSAICDAYGVNNAGESGMSALQSNLIISEIKPPVGCVTSGILTDESVILVPTDRKDSPLKDCKKLSKSKGCCTTCKRPIQTRAAEDSGDRRQSERIYMKNYKLPFSELPTECKLMVLSYLNPCERAMAALVCKEWEQLVKLSTMWSQVDLTIFNIAPLTPHRLAPFNRYLNYKCNEQHDRTIKYMEYLIEIKPTMKCLKFKFDISCHREDWLNRVYMLLDSSRKSGSVDSPMRSTTMLTKLICDWTITPMEPNTEQFCCIFNKIRTMFRRHLQRVKAFHEMLEKLSDIAPRLEHAHFPFDWSPRSVLLLSRLQNLQVLKLGKYVNPHGLEQLHVDALLSNLPQLKHLELAVCIPLFSNMTLYTFTHPRLQTLDIAYCQGVFVQALHLPELVHLKLLRQYWRGRLVRPNDNVIPCLHDVLCRGAPKLQRVNKHRLPSFWTEFLYDELDHLLYRVCSCKEHIYRTV